MAGFQTPYRHGDKPDNYIVQLGAILLDDLFLLNKIVEEAKEAIVEEDRQKFMAQITKLDHRLSGIKNFVAETGLI